MPSVQVLKPYETFLDIDGDPLEDGYLYIGVDTLNPETNPVQAYWDEALAVPATQPIRTKGGYPSNAGTISRIYVASTSYSLRVKNKNGTQVSQDLAVTSPTDAYRLSFLQNIAGAITRSVESKLYESISVLDINPALGFGQDATAAINQALLNGNRRVYIPKGTYVVNSDLRIYPNTIIYGDGESTILIHSGVGEGMFINGLRGDPTFATGYNGVGNILIMDMRLQIADGNFSSAQKAYFQFGHGRNIMVSNVTCYRLYRGHFIEFNACQNAFAVNCKFSDQTVLVGDASRDAINIDFAYEAGFPAFGSYDGTVCDNVGSIDCHFENVHTGPASHGATATAHTNIKIWGNTLKNMGLNGIWSRWWNDSSIKNNYIDGCGAQAIYIQSSNRVIESDNTVIGAAQTVATHAVQIQDSFDCDHSGGSVRQGSYPVQYQYAVRAFGGGRNRIISRGLTAGSSGLYNNTSPNTTVDDLYIYTITDDTVLVLPVPVDRLEGMIAVLSRSASLVTCRGTFYYRATGTAAVVIISKVAGSTSAETTGVLTGTTGADGIMTISADTVGNFYIENRRGSDVTVSVRFLA